MLRRLTRVLDDQEQVTRLTQTTDPRDIIEALTGERPAATPRSADVADYANFIDTVILNKTGLHARPAATFVDRAKRFQADIKGRHGDAVANGKSLISLLQLGVEHGATVRVSAQGSDAAAALDALQSAIAVGLGDEPEEQLPPAPGRGSQGWSPQAAGATIAGIPASGGLAIGPVRKYQQQSALIVTDNASDPISEGDQLQRALNAAQDELDRLHEEVKTRLGSGKAAIFRVHAEFLNDAALVMQTVSLIYQGHSAAWAWQHVIDERVHQMQQLDDPIIAGRAVDLSDVGQRVLQQLVGTADEHAVALDAPAILLADDLTPSDTATLDLDMILGLCTAKGGPTSHTAILARDSVPTEDEQFEAYRAMAQALGDRPLIIRTLDIGGDKEVPYLHLPKEDNAFLGVRGIRLCLVRPDLFIPQLRAIYRAATYGRIHIMFPMISTLEDVERTRAITEQVRQELNAPPVPLGIMVEVPSAAILADHLAREVDFFSIGTNDLTQYTLAMDRLHPQLARQADALHPAVLRMIERTVQAARSAGKWVGVCGGLAGDLKGAVILTGLGVSELSVSVPSIPAVKAEIRSHSLADMQKIAQQALKCRTAAEVRSL